MINWFELYTTDFDRAMTFYTTVFGVSLTEVPMDNERHPGMRYALFPGAGAAGASATPSAAGALVKLGEVKPGAGGTLIYFATETIEPELARVDAAGGKVLRGKWGVGEFGFIALVEDSEGNLIGLHSAR